MSPVFPSASVPPPESRAAAARARRRARRVRLGARVCVLALVAAGVSGFGLLRKPVTLDIDGMRREVTTFAASVGALLEEQGVIVSERDLVAPELGEPVERGGEVVVKIARPLDLEIDGESQRVWTTEGTVEAALAEIGVRAASVDLSVSRSAAVSRLSAPVAISTPKTITASIDGEPMSSQTTAETVGEALSELGVVLEAADRLSVPVTTPMSDGIAVEIIRAVAKDGSKRVVTEFETVKEEDPTLYKGEEKVVQKGRIGERLVTFTKTVVDGEVVDREVLAEVVVSKPRKQIVKVGTKPLPPVARAGSASVPNVSVNVSPNSAKGIARGMVPDDDQFRCLVALWDRESGWRVNAANRYSGAYGIPQAMPGSKMASAGADWKTNPATQIKWGLGYIKGRYGTPCGAWSAFQSMGWY